MWIAAVIALVLLLSLILYLNRRGELPGIAPPKPLNAFWRPGVYKYEGNLYERAVFRNETIDFLLGKGVYFKPGDWGYKDHEPLYAFNVMTEYAKIHSCQKMLQFLERDIVLILEKDITPQRLYIVLDYIFLYLWDYDKIVTTKWEISDDIKKMIQQHLNRFIDLYGLKGKAFEHDMPKNEFYIKGAVELIDKIKERLGIDLLE
jgi:hypothetical protein